MENKRTEELRKYKASVKSKLMAAIAMLMVSSILLSSTTYAWFVLSTAPEVKGMSTTVGSNGSLEIALLNDDTAGAPETIKAGVGDSSAAKGYAHANETWGNIVDISTGYGMNNISLYPSALNLAEGNTRLASLYSPLSVPVYGVDGRVAELSAEDVVSGKYDATAGGFQGVSTDYGVRAVGTASNVDPVARALNEAQNYYRVALINAQSTATNALDGPESANAIAMAKLLMAPRLEGRNDFSIDVTDNDVTALGNMIAGLDNTLDYIEAALRLYVVGYEAANENKVVNAEDINLSEYTYIKTYNDALNKLRQDVQSAQSTYDGVTDNDYSPVLDKLVNQNATYINDKLASEYTSADADTLVVGPKISVRAGLLSDVASFVDSFKTEEFNVDIVGSNLDITDAEITASPAVTPAYLPFLKTNAPAEGSGELTGLDNMVVTNNDGEGESGVPMIVTEYGYVIDLAFRASATTNLMLSEAKNRVDEDALTQGSGSTFTLTSGDAAVMDALRIVFVNGNTGTFDIIGIAAPVATDTEGEYVLHMFDWSVTNGILTLGAQKADDTILQLLADTIQKISVLVYLDGNEIGTTLDITSGMLNLQFKSDTTLEPMDYTGYVSTVDNGDNATTASSTPDNSSDPDEVPDESGDPEETTT